MKIMRYVSAATIAALLSTGTAQALSLTQGAKPRENPPLSYKGDVYVDSRGCAYARANIGKAVNWVPRLTPDRQKVVCGLNPTFAAGTPRSAAPPAPIKPPAPAEIATASAPSAPAATTTTAQTTASVRAPISMATPSGAPKPTVFSNTPAPTRQVRTTASVNTGTGWNMGNLPTPSPAPEPTLFSSSTTQTTAKTVTVQPTRRMAVTCPQGGGNARVIIGGSTVNVNCGNSMTAQRTYNVRSGDATVQLVARPAPVVEAQARTVASYTQYRPATSSNRVVIGGTAPSVTTASRQMSMQDRVRAQGVITASTVHGATVATGNARVRSFTAPAHGTSYEAYLASKAAAYGTTVVTKPAAVATSTRTVVVQKNTTRMPASNPRVIVNAPTRPAGYRAAWDDGRLNPQRGPRTVQGEYQMMQVWTDTVPRKLVTCDPRTTDCSRIR